MSNKIQLKILLKEDTFVFKALKYKMVDLLSIRKAFELNTFNLKDNLNLEQKILLMAINTSLGRYIISKSNSKHKITFKSMNMIFLNKELIDNPEFINFIFYAISTAEKIPLGNGIDISMKRKINSKIFSIFEYVYLESVFDLKRNNKDNFCIFYEHIKELFDFKDRDIMTIYRVISLPGNNFRNNVELFRERHSEINKIVERF